MEENSPAGAADSSREYPWTKPWTHPFRKAVPAYANSAKSLMNNAVTRAHSLNRSRLFLNYTVQSLQL
jgi:hypothetical protein